jgi:TPR repeat protein
MSSPKPLLYNPDQKSKQQLIAEFVIRRREFANLMQGLEASAPHTSPQHYLVVGQRGMGKTTLLLRVKYAVEDHPQLNKWLVPIRFSEEQYQIARLDRFWEEIADHLSIADASFDGLLEEMEKHEEADDYERIALDLLIRVLKKHKKRVLVMVDNLGDLFNKFSDEENHRLREVLLSKTEIQLMGASSMMLEHTFRYDKPFYEFFQQVTLEPIGREHALELLRILGKQYGQEDNTEELIKENPTKIEVLRRLTGGVPRTMALLFGIFIDHRHGTTFEDLQLLVDEVNSLYKHRMDEMKPQQQRIVDALSRAWDPISANEVLQRSKLNREGIATNQISAQLKVLTENQVVEPVPGPGKNKTYRIRERFFNIWYLMRYGKKQHKEEVLWLVRFLETWCTKKELQLQAEQQMKALKLGSYSRQAAYLKTMALYHVEGIEASQKLQLLEQAETYLKVLREDTSARTIEKVKRVELDKYVNKILKKLEKNTIISVVEDLPNATPESKIYVIYSVVKNIYEVNVPLLKIKDLLEAGVLLGDVLCMAMMGEAYEPSDIQEAKKYYLMAAERGDVEAMHNIAFIYQYEENDLALAKKYYLSAIEKGHLGAMENISTLYYNEKNFDLAERYCLMAVEKGSARAMYNVALIYHEEKYDLESAKRYYLMAIEKGNANAMNNLAIIYENETNTFELVEKYYLLAIERGNIDAMCNLATFYLKNNHFNLSEEYFLMAVKNGDLKALYNLAVFYHNKQMFDEAEKYYLKAIEKGNVEAMYNLALLYENEKKQYDTAEKYYLMAIEKDHVGAMNNLAYMYSNKVVSKQQMVEHYFKLAHSKGDSTGAMNLIIYYSKQDEVQEMLRVVFQILNHKEVFDNEDNTFKLLYHILLKKQYYFLLQQFKDPELSLMRYARPFYYVLAWFMRDELPGEYEKVGPEIKETVDEIIQELQKEYDKSEVLETEMKD